MEDLKNFEIIKPYQPYQGKFSIYFIESHSTNESNSIKLELDKKEPSIENLIKVDEKELKLDNCLYKINLYKFNFTPSALDKKKIKYENEGKKAEIKIILSSKKCLFESINKIDIERDNFLGSIKFSEYKWYLGMKYQPPNHATLTDLQIMKYFIDALILKENKNKSDLCFTELIKYGAGLLKINSYFQYDFELFILVYINTFHNESGNLIPDALDLFDLDKIKVNDKQSLLGYIEELDNIYKNQYYHLEKMNLKEEKYLIKFYTLYLYFLKELNLNEKLITILYELLDKNKYDQLILPKLYLSDFFPFYQSLFLMILQ